MKNVIVICILLTTFTAKGQTSIYKPFLSGNATWMYQYYDDQQSATGQFLFYSFDNDTIINSISYKKITKNGSYTGALRESNKVVYFIPDTSFSEYLLYDFNLNLGDTLLHPYGGAVCANDSAIVIYVDSVYASDGYHRRIYFNSFAVWIEGIGSTNYLLNPCNVWCVSGNDVLECITKDSLFSYFYRFYHCNVSITEVNSALDNVNLHPNPFQALSELTLSSNMLPAEIIIFNTNGGIVTTISINNLKTLIDRKNMVDGIYFYKVTSHGKSVTGKFIAN